MNKHKLKNRNNMKKGVLLGILLCIGTFSNAATINVINTNDSGAGSLRQAISDANSLAGTDIIDATGITGTITLLSTLPIVTESVTINGPTAGNLTLDAGGVFRVLQLSSGNNIINYLTIINGGVSISNSGGGGIYNTGNSLTLDHCIISNCTNNAASGNLEAGGIYSEGLLNMTYCRVTNNSCTANNLSSPGNLSGGGIMLAGYSIVSIENCLIDNNSLNGGTNKKGAGIAFDDNSNFSNLPGALTISNSTISGNSINNGTNNSGSAISILNFNDATILITQSTIAYNICQGGSTNNGAFTVDFGTDPIIQSNIFSSNTPENIEAFSMTSLGYNIKDDNSGFYTLNPTDLDNTDPLLLPLQDNGGFTYTHALQCTSPAIDNGAGLNTDQRDSLAFNQRDAGAYEFRPSLYGIDNQITCSPYLWIDGITYASSTSSPTFVICDSIVTLNLTVNSPANGIDLQSTCGNYTWIDGNTYASSTNSPTFTIVGGAFNGCDSIVTLNLTVNPSSNGIDVQSTCGTYTWIDGNTYASSTNSPTFTIVGGAFNGCDSIVTLNLTVNPSSNGIDVHSACGTYTWIDGNTYASSTNSPTYTIAGGAFNGCDSTVTLNLTVNSPANGIDVQSTCGNYTWIDGNTYASSTNSPTYTIAGGAYNGCDSLVTLDLTINNVSDLTTSASGLTITSNNSSATYQWLDCDNGNSEINGETGQSFTATINGNYSVELTENGCVDTTACVAITTVGIVENSFGNSLLVYPNPTSGNFSIDLGSVYESSVISITDISGKLIDSKTISQSQVLNLDIREPAGIYIISIQSGDRKAIIRLIKE
jgi:hypothetical protein